MPKNIILLSDGTGNSAGKLHKTNVWRLYQALDLIPPDKIGGPEQIAHYHDGVGSSSFKPFAILGGAFGWGLKRSVIDLYTFVCRNYRDGDRIYAFGFSRGAFTIRVLVGLIANQGLISADGEADLRRRALDAFRDYRRQKYKTILRLEVVGRAIRNALGALKAGRAAQPEARRHPRIRFVGVWDTVAAYGLPFDELTRAWNAVFPLSVPDRNLSDKVDRACHAIALDDERNTFHPVLWNEAGAPAEKHIAKERITQVWFSGVHSNVGGGYADDALANVSLHWMMKEAEREGLAFKAGQMDAVRSAGHIDGKMYDSRQGVGGAYRYLPRKMQPLLEDIDYPDNQVIIKHPKIHESVFQRMATGAERYAPIVLPASYSVVDTDGAIHDLTPAEREFAQSRVIRQESVWNLVWGRRIVYFISVGVATLLIIFPVLFPATAACVESLCALAWLIHGVAAVLPDFLNPWFAAYETHVSKFVILASALAVLLVIGGRMRTAISDRMHRIWINSPQAPPPRLDELSKFRLSEPYIKTWKITKRAILPTVVGVIALFLIVAVVTRALFGFSESAGWVCKNSEPDTFLPNIFQTRAVCWESDITLREGMRYRLTISIDEPWRDRKIYTGVQGYGRESMSALMYLGMPFRRHLFEPWFKPVARIGSKGTDDYPLDPRNIVSHNANKTLIAEITARSTGKLFIFVNDAVSPFPWWQPSYRNNEGTAQVTVELAM